jgi:hypothetical protein
MDEQQNTTISKWSWAWFFVILSFAFSLASLIVVVCCNINWNLELISSGIAFAFIGVLATFIVISNFMQVKEIEEKVKETDKKYDDIKDEIEASKFYTDMSISFNDMLNNMALMTNAPEIDKYVLFPMSYSDAGNFLFSALSTIERGIRLHEKDNNNDTAKSIIEIAIKYINKKITKDNSVFLNNKSRFPYIAIIYVIRKILNISEFGILKKEDREKDKDYKLKSDIIDISELLINIPAKEPTPEASAGAEAKQ